MYGDVCDFFFCKQKTADEMRMRDGSSDVCSSDLLDGVVQTTEGDEFVYHEMMAHVPIMAHGQASRVLISGGGDGGMAREVLRHRAVERVTMVELDRGVVDMSRRHLPSLSAGAFDDPRLEQIGRAHV